MNHDEKVAQAKEQVIDAVRAWAKTRFPPSLSKETKVRLALSALENAEEAAREASNVREVKCNRCQCNIDRGSDHETYTVILRSSISNEHAIADHLMNRENYFNKMKEAVVALMNVRSTLPVQDGDEWVLVEVERWWRPNARGFKAREIEVK